MSPMTFPQQVAVILLCILATTGTRFLPFLIFSGKKETPAFVPDIPLWREKHARKEEVWTGMK